MISQKAVITTALLLVVIAGAALQGLYWNDTRETNFGTVGEYLTLGALVLLAIFAPRHARQLNEPMRDWRINLLFGVVVIITLLVLIGFVYSRYYEPLIQSINSNGEAASILAQSD